MKLSVQASQYWTNLENKRAVRGQLSIDTWNGIKEELEAKYVPSYGQLTSIHLGNKSV